jgi:hypothetical protein
LGGLSQREVAQYVELEASEIASSELVAGLHAETKGNPFFLSEIVRLLALEGLPTEPTAEVRVGSRRASVTSLAAGSITSQGIATGCWCSPR